MRHTWQCFARKRQLNPSITTSTDTPRDSISEHRIEITEVGADLKVRELDSSWIESLDLACGLPCVPYGLVPRPHTPTPTHTRAHAHIHRAFAYTYTHICLHTCMHTIRIYQRIHACYV